MTAANKIKAGVGEACTMATFNNIVTYTRSTSSTCSKLGLVNGCDSKSSEGVKITIYCCTSNLCNGASISDSVSVMGDRALTMSSGAPIVRSQHYLIIIATALALLAY